MEDSYTQVPNDLMEILISPVPNNSERRLLILIARKTYGFHKNSDGISFSQFQNKLGMARDTVSKNLGRLRLVGLVELVRRGGSKKSPNIYQINLDDYNSKLVRLTGLVRYDKQKLVGQLGHTKESITKEKEIFFSPQKEDEIWKRTIEADQEYFERKGGLTNGK